MVKNDIKAGKQTLICAADEQALTTNCIKDGIDEMRESH